MLAGCPLVELEAVRSLAAVEPSDLTQALYEQVLEFSGGDLGDDLALLALHLQPIPARTATPQAIA